MEARQNFAQVSNPSLRRLTPKRWNGASSIAAAGRPHRFTFKCLSRRGNSYEGRTEELQRPDEKASSPSMRLHYIDAGL